MLLENLSKLKIKVLVQIKNNKDTKIYLFGQGSEFIGLSEKGAIQKMEEQVGKAKIAENDSTLRFANKIQKILCRRKK